MKEGLVVVSVVAAFVFLVSMATWYVEQMIPSDVSCQCFVPIPLIVLTLSSLGVFVGTVLYYSIFLHSEARKRKSDLEVIASLLPNDEALILRVLVKSGGALKQSKLVSETKLGRVRVSRLLDRMEKIVVKKKRGRTNLVRLREKFAKRWL